MEAESPVLKSIGSSLKFAGWVFNGFDMRKKPGATVATKVGADLAHRNVISTAVQNSLILNLQTITSYTAVPSFVTRGTRSESGRFKRYGS